MKVRRLSLAACAAIGLALTVFPTAPASAVTPDPAKTYVVDCKGDLKIKPKQIVLACGDGGVFIKGITWSAWDMNGATGRGTLVENVCVPTCGAGNVNTYKGVKLTLGGVATEGALNVFSLMNGAFKGDGGPAMTNRVTWTLDNPVN